MSLQSARETLAIHEITDPWLRLRSCSPALDNGGLNPQGPYACEGELLPYAASPEEAAIGEPREVRAVMLRRAEDVIGALEAAGWHLCGEFAVEITGSGVLLPGRPSLQGGGRVRMRFKVDKHRSDEEMAMHPERVADDIMARLERGETPWNG